jgi:quercetin dioxygenase-like cupin family protein
MGLVELSAHTGLSAALLSKLERGRLFPTLPTLLRIALVFGVGLEYFFFEDKKRTVGLVRQNERLRFPEKPGVRDPAYHFEVLDFNSTDHKSNAYYAEFEPVPPEKTRAHQHAGFEFLYITRGKMCLRVAAEEYELESGDAACFDSAVPHSYRSTGAKQCCAVVIVIP